MNIGIDLDNTLINYDDAIAAAAESLLIPIPLEIRSKVAIRNFVRSKPDGEFLWQKIQGQAYGNFALTHAKLFSGVERFLWRCRQRGHNITVVSHKTEYGHGDSERIPLRQVAIEFLTRKGLLNTEQPLLQHLVFKNTQFEKIDCIWRSEFRWFIDDLPEVVSALIGTSMLTPILFLHNDQASSLDCKSQLSALTLTSWQQIDTKVNGEWSQDEIKALAHDSFGIEAASVTKQRTGGNGAVFKLTRNEGAPVKLKIYSIDEQHNRLISEFRAIECCAAFDENFVAQPIGQNLQLNIGAYEWIEGNPVTNVTRADLDQSLRFLQGLHVEGKNNQRHGIPRASASCLSGRDIEQQITYRISQYDLPRKQNAELDHFFALAFVPAFADILPWAKENWPKDIDFDTPLPKTLQTLSPSDYGFHNALKRPNGSLAFLDFEYFGWDDPTKLIADFSFHPAMALTRQQKTYWLEGALKIYGQHLAGRLSAARPLYGLIWCLIVLNEFRSEVWQRRLLANNSKSELRQKTLESQLRKARTLLNDIKLSLRLSSIEVIH